MKVRETHALTAALAALALMGCRDDAPSPAAETQAEARPTPPPAVATATNQAGVQAPTRVRIKLAALQGVEPVDVIQIGLRPPDPPLDPDIAPPMDPAPIDPGFVTPEVLPESERDRSGK